MELSVVIPLFNEEEVIGELFTRLTQTLQRLKDAHNLPDHDIEVILVNDGSSDNTLALAIELTRKNSSFKVINLSRNFGHQIASTAGIEHAAGNAVVLMDADLQDPPEFILDLYAKQKEGFDVVYARRLARSGESFLKIATAKLFYRMMRLMAHIDIPVDTGDFRIMSRKVVNVLNGMKEKHRFIRGMITWIGFKQTGIYYQREERFAGQSKYPFRKMVKLAWDGMSSFSTFPLRLVTYLGFSIACMGFLYSIYVVYAKIYLHETISGWSSLMIVILFMSGVNLITLGVIGQYIGRISEESKQRPLYIIEGIYKE
jgi:dolichol-phosphate mannosyltransferase